MAIEVVAVMVVWVSNSIKDSVSVLFPHIKVCSLSWLGQGHVGQDVDWEYAGQHRYDQVTTQCAPAVSVEGVED